MLRLSLLLFSLAHPARTLGEIVSITLRVRLSRKTRVEGFTIHVANYLDDPGEFIERVAASLRLIRSIEPRRYQRIARDLQTLLISDLGVSSYSFITNVCTLDQRLVRTKSAGTLALAIIHEATHARLYHNGIVTWRRIQGRVERACIHEEIEFTKRLAAAGWHGTAEMIPALQGASNDPSLMERRLFEARASAMEASSLPRWLVRAWIACCRPRQ